MTTKREAAVKVTQTAMDIRTALENNAAPFAIEYALKEKGDATLSKEILSPMLDALAAFDAAPDDEEAGREERTEAQSMADVVGRDLERMNVQPHPDWAIKVLLVAIRHDLRALAAAVKERR